MRTLSLAWLTAAFIGLGATAALADISQTDRNFVVQAATGGFAEVDLGRLAAQKGTTSAIKQYGQRLVTDHSQANEELMQIADEAGIELPTEMDRRTASTLQRLRGTTGTGFDQAFIQRMIADHQRDIQLFRKEAQSGSDPTIKGFAQRYLPILQVHLQMAQGLNRPDSSW
ncbi:MAG: hypothetical protein BGO51_26005 [Rhodospirillales bacterium 69-11]|nr:DUF4142 domain-containing protein [Rhodospirillales bacterium]MBN8926196.1 DUF4142 domain-containing protein [Rhodospirillales bacterium]OJW20947.1 MAG: hypothetical protein BGO51_26005 [Rhodospirillales bacterium 69-11]